MLPKTVTYSVLVERSHTNAHPWLPWKPEAKAEALKYRACAQLTVPVSVNLMLSIKTRAKV